MSGRGLLALPRRDRLSLACRVHLAARAQASVLGLLSAPLRRHHINKVRTSPTSEAVDGQALQVAPSVRFRGR